MEELRVQRFETKRLRVERWTATRAAAPLRAILTPAVLAHLPPSLQEEDPETWIIDRLEKSDVYAIEAEGALIGVLILARSEAVHLGYLLAEDAWGRGYGSELVQGLVAALRAEAPVQLRAGVEVGNPASARILQKAGFRPVHCDAPDTELYALSLT